MWIKTREGWRPLYRPCVNSNDLKGVYTATTLSEVRAEIAARCERFCAALNDDGARSFNEPLFGAFGEKL